MKTKQKVPTSPVRFFIFWAIFATRSTAILSAAFHPVFNDHHSCLFHNQVKIKLEVYIFPGWFLHTGIVYVTHICVKRYRTFPRFRSRFTVSSKTFVQKAASRNIILSLKNTIFCSLLTEEWSLNIFFQVKKSSNPLFVHAGWSYFLICLLRHSMLVKVIRH